MSAQVTSIDQFASFPAELKALPNWVVWRLEKRSTSDKKPTKVPYDPKTHRKAESDNPTTWSDFETALTALASSRKYSGIGFEFGIAAEYTGIDFDHVISSTGEVAPWALAWLRHMNSYSEVSFTGDGLHVFIRGQLALNSRHKKTFDNGSSIEVYDSLRYFAVTGKHFEDAPLTVEDRPEQLAELYAEILPPVVDEPAAAAPAATAVDPTPAGDLSDDDIIGLARRARNGAKFERLFAGDTSGHGNDDSSADEALCCILAFYTRDVNQIDRLFRRSGLMRDDKWDRANYRWPTVTKALSLVTDTYHPPRPKKAASASESHAPGATDDFVRAAKNGTSNEKRKIEQPKIISADELLAMDIEEPSMLIPELLPTGGACLLFGAQKSNKTLIAVQVAIAVATGHALFDYYSISEHGPVLVVEQDDPAGASSIKGILERSPVPTKGIPLSVCPYHEGLTFGAEFIDWLRGEIKARGLRLVVLDSYTALRPSRGHGIDIVKVEQTELNLLDRLAKETNCCILIIHHDSKGSSALDWSQKSAGTYAMGAATEVQIHTCRFPELASNAPERLLQVRGRHIDGTEMVLRFRKPSLDHEHIIEGGAASLFPLLQQIKSAFGNEVFSPKGLIAATGVSRSTGYRYIERLYQANALRKHGYGEYILTVNL